MCCSWTCLCVWNSKRFASCHEILRDICKWESACLFLPTCFHRSLKGFQGSEPIALKLVFNFPARNAHSYMWCYVWAWEYFGPPRTCSCYILTTLLSCDKEAISLGGRSAADCFTHIYDVCSNPEINCMIIYVAFCPSLILQHGVGLGNQGVYKGGTNCDHDRRMLSI